MLAVARGHELAAQGADIVDVGGESTRPGREPGAGRERSAASCRSSPPAPARAPVTDRHYEGRGGQRAARRRRHHVNDVTALPTRPQCPGVADAAARAADAHARRPAHDAGRPRYGDVVADVRRSSASAPARWHAGCDARSASMSTRSASARRPSTTSTPPPPRPARRPSGRPVVVGHVAQAFPGADHGPRRPAPARVRHGGHQRPGPWTAGRLGLPRARRPAETAGRARGGGCYVSMTRGGMSVDEPDLALGRRRRGSHPDRGRRRDQRGCRSTRTTG